MNNIEVFKDCKLEFVDNINNLTEGGYLIEVSDNKNAGFNYPYLLFIPNNVNIDSTIIVEGSNTGISTVTNKENEEESILQSIDNVRNYFKAGHPIKRINERITNYPFLYPLFPRINYEGNDIYNHMLSSNSMFSNNQDSINLGINRTDLQLIEMIKDASDRLRRYGLNIDDKVIMYGFSASSKFANRFTLLHPEMIKCTFATALGGTITLPLRELNGEKLLWPIGIGNVEEITDEKLELYKEIPQYYYQGMLDNNDCYKPNDRGIGTYNGILQNDEAIQMYKLLGKNMNEDRWENTRKIIDALNYNITLKSCDFSHNPHMMNDIIEEKLSKMINEMTL